MGIGAKPPPILGRLPFLNVFTFATFKIESLLRSSSYMLIELHMNYLKLVREIFEFFGVRRLGTLSSRSLKQLSL